ncbi:MAG: hypothetical protein Q9218_006885 [Villophora microphyllina]
MSGISNLTTTTAPLWESSQNHGPLVSVLAWFLIIVSFLSILARVGTRYAVVRELRTDDAIIIVALVGYSEQSQAVPFAEVNVQILSVAHTATTSIQAANGLGKHDKDVPKHALEPFQKSIYAGGFLYISVIALIKLSICLHLDNLTPVRLHRNFIRGLGAFVCLWSIASILAVAFQCHPPAPWQFIRNKCINITGFWAAYDVINVVTDAALIIMPWKILSKLQVEARKKAIIIGCFAARIFVVAATIVQIYFLLNRTSGAYDLTYNPWIVVLLAEIVLTISLVTACIPYLKPFMEALETGMMRASGGATSRGQGFGFGDRSTSGRSKQHGYGSKMSNKPSRSQLSIVRMDSLGFAGEKDKQHGRGTVTVSANGRGRADSDEESQSSQSRIIRKTVGWSVTEEQQVSPPPRTPLG